MSEAVRSRLQALAEEFSLPPGAAAKLLMLLEAVAAAPVSLTSVRDPALAVDVHVADSLTALALPELRAASQIADLGSGGGFPGLPLAIALQDASVTLIESVGRKATFLERVFTDLGLHNVKVVARRVEDWREGSTTFDVVCVRAVAPLNTLVEYAAPLLRPGGVMVAWKGEVPGSETSAAAAAAAIVGIEPMRIVPVPPAAGAVRRTLHVYRSVGSVPNRFPRRAGMARKRPLGS